MKNKKTLLITLTLPFLLLNCTGKTTKPSKDSTPKNTQHSEQRATTNHRPISYTPPPKPTTRPNVQHRETYGESSYNKICKLPHKIRETSGLIKLDNMLWTLNDSGGKAALYQIDEHTGRILKTLTITNARNKDWEDLAYDDNYLYIGDFGNNRGKRKDLKIYKIPRAALRRGKSVRAEIIHFKYSDQKNFNFKAYKHNFDCEAMVAHNGKLYLFSKNWGDKKTRLYELSTNAGKQIARYKSTFNTQGMVTGASLNKELDILLLTTYSSLLNVNIWAFTNYKRANFFSGNAKSLNFEIPLQAQIEGITFKENYKAYLSSEAFKKYIFSFDAALYELDFRSEFE